MGLRRHIAYLRYLSRHKWYVFLECVKMGMLWRGIIHDWHKFLPSEWFPYAQHFYEANGTRKTIRDKTGYYKPTDTGDASFDFAWLLHQKRAQHHWQWWCIPEDERGIKIFPMDVNSWFEMVADWRGASRAHGSTGTASAWYEANQHKLRLHDETRQHVEFLLSVIEPQRPAVNMRNDDNALSSDPTE